MNIASGILFCFTLYIGIKEILLIWDWYKIKSKNIEVFYGEITGVIKRHDMSPVYHIKINNPKFSNSLKLKTSIISSLLPRLLGWEFRIIINQNETYCMIYHPLFYVLTMLIVILLTVFSITFFIW